MRSPIVSVCCITYNHEKYIADAIDSFLMQKTNFPIEIIIHDDASTDGTADIIRRYEKIHPNIIKGIYQKENQYSRKGKIRVNHVAKRVRGKYVATCEGDDFWLDPMKLQRQFDFMEANGEYILCCHRVKAVDREKRAIDKIIEPYEFGSRDYTIEDIMGGGFIHFSSRFYRSEYYINDYPDWTKGTRHGDNMTALYIVLEGKVYFIEETMSAYRLGVENSFMSLYEASPVIDRIKNRVAIINGIEKADEFYNFKYQDVLKHISKRWMRTIVAHIMDENMLPEDIKGMLSQEQLVEITKTYNEQKDYIEFKEKVIRNEFNKNIIGYLKDNRYNRIAIYGYGTIGKHIYTLLQENGIEVPCFIENINKKNIELNIIPIFYVSEMENVDAIIVTPFNDFSRIRERLEQEATWLNIISLKDMLGS